MLPPQRLAGVLTLAAAALVAAWLGYLAILSFGGALLGAILAPSSATLLAIAVVLALLGGRLAWRGAPWGAEVGIASGLALALAALLRSGDALFSPWDKVALALGIALIGVNAAAALVARAGSRAS